MLQTTAAARSGVGAGGRSPFRRGPQYPDQFSLPSVLPGRPAQPDFDTLASQRAIHEESEAIHIFCDAVASRAEPVDLDLDAGAHRSVTTGSSRKVAPLSGSIRRSA